MLVCASGIRRTARVAVGQRVVIDDATDRALLGGDLHFDAAPRAAVARDDNFALHTDAAPGEHLVVARQALVHVHQRTDYFAFAGVGVVRRQRLALERFRHRVGRDDFFLQRRLEWKRPQHRKLACLGRGEQHVENFNLCVVSPLAKQPGNVLGVLLGFWRTDIVRSKRHLPHPCVQILRLQQRLISLLQRQLLIRRSCC